MNLQSKTKEQDILPNIISGSSFMVETVECRDHFKQKFSDADQK